MAWQKAKSSFSLIKKLKKNAYKIIAVEQSKNSTDYKKVLASGETLMSVASKVRGKKAIFKRVLPADVNFSPAEYEI